MKFGIGLPATIPGVDGATILDWARRADNGPFSTLGIIDRIVYPNYEPLITLAAVAGATQRIRLMPTVLLAPIRPAGVLAKEAATLDAISGGRLTLGLGIGRRPDDYAAAPATFRDRGRRFEAQLDLMKRIWAGERVSDDAGPVGPKPVQSGGPEILIGGATPVAVRRVARWADGFIAGGGGPQRAKENYDIAAAAWQEAGRPGQPRFAAGVYLGLGPEAAERGPAYVTDYYGAAGEAMAKALPTTPEAVKAAIQSYADVGVDELFLWPVVPNLDQVDRLADLVG